MSATTRTAESNITSGPPPRPIDTHSQCDTIHRDQSLVPIQESKNEDWASGAAHRLSGHFSAKGQKVLKRLGVKSLKSSWRSAEQQNLLTVDTLLWCTTWLHVMQFSFSIRSTRWGGCTWMNQLRCNQNTLVFQRVGSNRLCPYWAMREARHHFQLQSNKAQSIRNKENSGGTELRKRGHTAWVDTSFLCILWYIHESTNNFLLLCFFIHIEHFLSKNVALSRGNKINANQENDPIVVQLERWQPSVSNNYTSCKRLRL